MAFPADCRGKDGLLYSVGLISEQWLADFISCCCVYWN